MSGNRIVKYGDEARHNVISGVQKLAKTVAVTMGPRGRNVIIQKPFGAPIITKDGVTVARQMVCKDPLEEIGCQLIKEVAGRTVDLAGDGTTTATVLAHGIITSCLAGLQEGEYNVNDLKRASKIILKEIVKSLNELALPINNHYETLRDIAIISTNNDVEFGTLIADAFRDADYTGTVMAEALPGAEDSVRQVNGIELKSGYASPGFLKNGNTNISFNKCPILILGEETELDEENIQVLTSIFKNKMPLLILAKSYSKEFLGSVVAMRTHANAHVCLVKVPVLGPKGIDQDDWLENLAALTSATIVGESLGLPLKDVGFSHLGYAESVEVSKFQTNILKPKRNIKVIEQRTNSYEELLSSVAYGETKKDDYKARIAFLKSKTTMISVGYATELELREKGDRFDDAIGAAKAALEEGVVPGGGFALVRAAQDTLMNKDVMNSLNSREQLAAKRYLSALYHPAFTIIENGLIDSKEVLKEYVERISQPEHKNEAFYGYNTNTESFGNLKELGVIDPKKVTRVALENATSIAILMLTTEAVIAEDPEDGAGEQPPAGFRLPNQGGFDHKY